MSQRTTRATAKKREALESSKDAFVPEVDCRKLTTKEILFCISARNKDPLIGTMVLSQRLPSEIADGAEAEGRARSVVFSGLPEPTDPLPSVRQKLG